MYIRDWLRSLGSVHYEAVFRQNSIDSDGLAELSEGDLEKLGIPLGDRKRFIKALRALVASKECIASGVGDLTSVEGTCIAAQIEF